MGTAMQQRNQAQEFRKNAVATASMLLRDWVGEDRAKEATGRIATAFAASAASARNPRDFYNCTPQSISTCIAKAALTGIMPDTGSTALAYVYPRRPRKGDQPQLQYSLNHRGINAVARRCGQTLIAIPIGKNDEISADSEGSVNVLKLELDDPPTTWEDMRGVVVIVKQLDTGVAIHCGWVPKKLIQPRRAMSLSDRSDFSPWKAWPVEMSMGAAMRYSVGRGWCVIDDSESARALSEDQPIDEPIQAAPGIASQDRSEELASRLAGPDESDDEQNDEPDTAAKGDAWEGDEKSGDLFDKKDAATVEK